MFASIPTFLLTVPGLGGMHKRGDMFLPWQDETNRKLNNKPVLQLNQGRVSVAGLVDSG